MQYLIGQDYRLQWVIGHGGMSTVWLADDPRHDREVAIKALRPEFSNSTEFLERFRNEAQAAENITSDNVVHTYDYREVSDAHGTIFCFIVMEYVRGESLADLLSREGSLPEAMALDVMEQAAHGLAAIHALGMVHRDIKPGNLLVTQEGKVKITDFGIAKAAAAVPLTRTGMVVGTAQYVSPEQAQGQEVGSTSDVYSLGVVGYEVLSGKRPFTGDSSVSVVLAHINQAPPALSTTISAQTRELIGIALRKEPGRRFTNGNEMAQAISQVRLGNRPPQPRSAVLTRPAPEPSPTAATVALGAVAQPTTVQPAAAPKRHVVSPTVPPARRQPPQPPEPPKREGLNVALAVTAALAVLLLVGFALYRMNFFGADSSAPAGSSTVSAPTVESTVITQYVEERAPAQRNDPGQAAPQSTAQPEPKRHADHRTREAVPEETEEREQDSPAASVREHTTVVEEPEQEAPRTSHAPDTPAQVNEDNSDVRLLTSDAPARVSEDAEGDTP
ncbi:MULTISPECIES: serine/threonine-protein kinase [unclassified Corynebacterium]|uniref:serine/threonine-protein kinase n=1 Tax=unclassified Corynebacterium TaxID=2624378 RepID=UPI00128BC5D2|nr:MULTISPECIES: serine/threonine-protein kinase [unclassified Corynebacterium]